MNTVEDRIRAATRAAANTVPPDGVPPLRLPTTESPRRTRRHRRAWGARRGPLGRGSYRPRWTPWLAPAAAALAVVVIVVAVVGIGHSVHHSGVTGTRPATTHPGPSVPGTTAGPPVSAYVRSGQIPPYYLAIDVPSASTGIPANAQVRATVSGHTLATIKPSGAGRAIVAVTAAADDRTFVLAEQARAPGTGAVLGQSITFYLVRLSSAGQPGPATRLPESVPTGQLMTGLALSPGGSELAIAIQPGRAGDASATQEIKVYPLGGGPVRTWSGDGIIGGPDDATSLSWADSQRTLAFNWQSGQVASVRLLNLESAGGSLLASSRQVMSVAAELTQSAGLSIITPDGSAIVYAASPLARADSKLPHAYTTSGFAEFSTATGRVTRVLGSWSGPEAVSVLWSDANGRVLIGIVASADYAYVGVISGNTFTPLNDQANTAAPDTSTW
jgi:hypothetical protein